MLLWPVVLGFGAIVLVFDTAWSAIAICDRYRYVYGTLGSFLIYVTAGFVAADVIGPEYGKWVGASVAVIEAVFGTLIADRIGAFGELTIDPRRLIPIVAPIQGVVGAVLGSVGVVVASVR